MDLGTISVQSLRALALNNTRNKGLQAWVETLAEKTEVSKKDIPSKLKKVIDRLTLANEKKEASRKFARLSNLPKLTKNMGLYSWAETFIQNVAQSQFENLSSHQLKILKNTFKASLAVLKSKGLSYEDMEYFARMLFAEIDKKHFDSHIFYIGPKEHIAIAATYAKIFAPGSQWGEFGTYLKTIFDKSQWKSDIDLLRQPGLFNILNKQTNSRNSDLPFIINLTKDPERIEDITRQLKAILEADTVPKQKLQETQKLLFDLAHDIVEKTKGSYRYIMQTYREWAQIILYDPTNIGNIVKPEYQDRLKKTIAQDFIRYGLGCNGNMLLLYINGLCGIINEEKEEIFQQHLTRLKSFLGNYRWSLMGPKAFKDSSLPEIPSFDSSLHVPDFFNSNLTDSRLMQFKSFFDKCIAAKIDPAMAFRTAVNLHEQNRSTNKIEKFYNDFLSLASISCDQLFNRELLIEFLSSAPDEATLENITNKSNNDDKYLALYQELKKYCDQIVIEEDQPFSFKRSMEYLQAHPLGFWKPYREIDPRDIGIFDSPF